MLVQEGTKLTSSPQKDNYEENKIDELRLLLESQRQDYRARFAAYGARSAVLIAGSEHLWHSYPVLMFTVTSDQLLPCRGVAICSTFNYFCDDFAKTSKRVDFEASRARI